MRVNICLIIDFWDFSESRKQNGSCEHMNTMPYVWMYKCMFACLCDVCLLRSFVTMFQGGANVMVMWPSKLVLIMHYKRLIYVLEYWYLMVFELFPVVVFWKWLLFLWLRIWGFTAWQFLWLFLEWLCYSSLMYCRINCSHFAKCPVNCERWLCFICIVVVGNVVVILLVVICYVVIVVTGFCCCHCCFWCC